MSLRLIKKFIAKTRCIDPAAEHCQENSAELESINFFLQPCAQGKGGSAAGGLIAELRPSRTYAGHGELSLGQVERVPAFCQPLLAQPSKGGGQAALPGHWLDTMGCWNRQITPAQLTALKMTQTQTPRSD